MEIRGHDKGTVFVSYTSTGCFEFASSPRTWAFSAPNNLRGAAELTPNTRSFTDDESTPEMNS